MRPALASGIGGRQRPRGLALGLSVLGIIGLAAIFADWLAPYSPIEQFRDALRLPPAWFAGGSVRFPLGTDEVGRDMLSRLLHGARASLLIGIAVAAGSMAFGLLLGLAAVFAPPLAGSVILRAMDVILSTPGLLLAIIVIALIGPSLANSIVAITLVHLPAYVRLARSAALAERAKDYVTAARGFGADPLHIMFVTVLPNCLPPVTVQATLGISTAILEAAALGFLGLGVPPPTAEWGAMLASARDSLESAPWVVTLPGLTILVTVLCVNLVGDGLRDLLDPKLRRL
ncbi:MAG: ABC transporter permease subunit [Bauldia sp.]